VSSLEVVNCIGAAATADKAKCNKWVQGEKVIGRCNGLAICHVRRCGPLASFGRLVPSLSSDAPFTVAMRDDVPYGPFRASREPPPLVIVLLLFPAPLFEFPGAPPSARCGCWSSTLSSSLLASCCSVRTKTGRLLSPVASLTSTSAGISGFFDSVLMH
jgi:hypothetical protein